MKSKNRQRFLFVQLGEQFPEYLIQNLKWVEDVFKEFEIAVVVDNAKNQEFVESLGFEGFLYQRSRTVDTLINTTKHDKHFREGFWHFTIDRLFAICEYVICKSNVNIIYIESDVLLLPNFPATELFADNVISWTRYNHLRDVPSLIHIAEQSSAEFLRTALTRIFEKYPGSTDMSALRLVEEEFAEEVMLLPTMVKGFENEHLVSRDEFQKCSRIANTEGVKFNGIFDGAVIGMYLTGQDPRNSYGLVRFLNSQLLNRDESYVDLNEVKFRMKGTRLFMMKESKSEVEIYNLHIHSKDIALFSTKALSHLHKLVIHSKKNKEYHRFKFFIFVDLVLVNIKQRTFIRFTVGFFRYLWRLISSRFMGRI